MNKLLLGGICAAIITLPLSAKADPILSYGSKGLSADSHAPIGVMGDHLHGKGEWMVSYRYMRMHMEDNRDGTNSLSPEEIVTAVPNRFGAPPTLRVVPLAMDTDMHMVGAMYAPSDRVTLMGMANYIDRKMDHVTFAGPAGTVRLGNFTTKSSGIGDTNLSALIGLYDDDMHKLHFNAGLSIPTGSIDETDNVLAPTGARPTLRLPYAMQLGSGTFDAMPALTYNGHHNKIGWGGQYMGIFRLGRNSEDYSWGDKHQINVWGSYAIKPWVSASLRVTGEHEAKIDGIDLLLPRPFKLPIPIIMAVSASARRLALIQSFPKGI